MKEKVSKLTYPTLQHCSRMLHIMHTVSVVSFILAKGSGPLTLNYAAFQQTALFE